MRTPMLTARRTGSTLAVTALMLSAAAGAIATAAEAPAGEAAKNGTLTVVLTDLPEFAGSLDCTLTDQADKKVSNDIKLTWEANAQETRSAVSYTLKPEGNDHYTLECGDTLAEGVETSPENQRVDLRWKPSAGAYGTISGTTDAQPTADIRFHAAADDKAEFAADVTGGIYRASMSSALDSGDYVGTVATRDMDTIYAAGYVDGTTQAQAAGKTPTVALKKGEAVRQDVKVVVGGTATGKVIDAQGKPGKGWIVRGRACQGGSRGPLHPHQVRWHLHPSRPGLHGLPLLRRGAGRQSR